MAAEQRSPGQREAGEQQGDDGQREILSRVRELVDTERELRGRLTDATREGDEERDRLVGIQRELDQCWDLLRQRRAKIEFGDDPDEARLRPATEVQRYLS
ncbi:DUF2630 family protein [Streptomyces bohaiensis]|uniref:DUF2630 family protein n=1 Tax=Streptomyces bohaiensis TaxID=1431344 RepID=A0ABX1CFN6_9ACTN|nr:DUF2630 family protein [Streptomyces bohaiensis]NJQ16983.1 DUF2630 family protein [Streptomyces bohaiensis]